MKPKKTQSKDLQKNNEPGQLSAVAAKLRGRELFPKKLEDAKKHLKNIKITSL